MVHHCNVKRPGGVMTSEVVTSWQLKEQLCRAVSAKSEKDIKISLMKRKFMRVPRMHHHMVVGPRSGATNACHVCLLHA